MRECEPFVSNSDYNSIKMPSLCLLVSGRFVAGAASTNVNIIFASLLYPPALSI